MFDADQKQALSAPLSRDHVKTREQAGRKLSYVEGWFAIAEANRIFGFDGWTRETLAASCVSEREREIGQNKSPGWAVTYTAKVRVTVGGVVREGCGAGHGIDRDLGQAHESAIKEAETDAMKRALMTFGNPFGLALYDKEQTNVQDEGREAMMAKASFMAGVKLRIENEADQAKLREWWSSDEQKRARREHGLSKDEVADLMTMLTAKLQGKAA